MRILRGSSSVVSLFTALLFFDQASLVVARWEEWPLIGLACFRFLPNWLCIKDAESWIKKNCDDDDLNQRNDTQLKILLDIYFQTDNGARSGPLYEQGWLSDCSYCNWEGIACDGEGNIIEFSFAESNPPLAGTIPTELGLLFALKKLNLRDNYFEGEVPTELGQLLNLEELELHGNSLEGEMPDEVCNLGAPNGRNIYISADCGRPRPEIKCRVNTCCDACYVDALRVRENEAGD